jgi:hypothetical protein
VLGISWQVSERRLAARGHLGPGSFAPYRGAVREQGWYFDPYGLHRERWFSGGTPTSLVRDDGVVSRDAPPPEPPPTVPVPVAEAQPSVSDTKRADSGVTGAPPYDGERGTQFLIH